MIADGKHIGLALFFCGAFMLAPLYASTITGKVVRVTDGDTIVVLDSKKVQHKVRLDGIDAPERKQDYGAQSKLALSMKVFGLPVRVEYKKRDKYGRILGVVWTIPDRIRDGKNVNLEMVREGWAWFYAFYSSDKNLASAEKLARSKKIGLWAGKVSIPPWAYRTGRRTPSPGDKTILPVTSKPTIAPPQAKRTAPTVKAKPKLTRSQAKKVRAEIQELEETIAGFESELRNVALDIRKKREGAKYEIKKAANNARYLGLDVNQASKDSAEEIRADIEVEVTVYKAMLSAITEKRATLKQKRAQLSK